MITVQPAAKNAYDKIKDHFTFSAERPPKDYQKRILNFIDTNSSLIVFHEMGTGKTVTGLLCAIDFLSQDINNTVYIVATKTLIANWQKEIQNFITKDSPLPSRISIGTIYDFKKTFKRSKFQPYEDRHLMIIVDESHNYKSAYLMSKTMKKKPAMTTMNTITTVRPPRLTRAIGTPDIITAKGSHRIMKKDSYYLLVATINIAKKVVFLTGTPFRNSLKDLTNMLQMIMILNQLSYSPTETISPFDVRVNHDTDLKRFMETPTLSLPSDEDIKTRDARAIQAIKGLRHMIDYEERSGDFPDYEIFYEKIIPPPEFLTSYLTAKKTRTKKSVAHVSQRIASISLDPRTKREQAPLPTSPLGLGKRKRIPSPSQTITITALPRAGLTKELSGKIQYLLGNVDADQYKLQYDDYIMTDSHEKRKVPDLTKTKTVIYSGVNIDYIEKRLPNLLKSVPGHEGLRFFFITGNRSAANREKDRVEFNQLRENAVLIISPAAKEGVDLKGVGHVYFLDGVWNPAEFEQIMGRAIRSGSHKDYAGIVVQVHILFDNHHEFPQEAMDNAVKKKHGVMTIFKNIAMAKDDPSFPGFHIQKNNPNPITPKNNKQLALVPIQLTQKQKYKTRFGIQYQKQSDDHLDLYQALSVKYTNSIYGPIPDNTGKIFSRIYNHEEYHAFDTYFNELRRILQGGVIDIIMVELDDQNPRNDKIDSKFSSIKMKPKMNIATLTQMTIFFCSIMEGDVGHYGIFIHESDKMFYYDSMLNTNLHEGNYYFDKFKVGMERHFILPAAIIIDFPTGPYGSAPKHVYSMEATGGNIQLENPYINDQVSFQGAEKEWCIKFQTLCSDNQNQFCYMWSILYMLCKILFLKGISTMDWIPFLKKICAQQLLPLAVIKVFIKLSIGIMPPQIQQIWKTVPLLRDYFPLITTNATTYHESMDMSNGDFEFYNILLKSGKRQVSPNLIEIWDTLIKHLKHIKLEKISIEKYKNEQLTTTIIQRLQPLLQSDRVFKPEIPMTYSEIVEALNTINSSEAGRFRFA